MSKKTFVIMLFCLGHILMSVGYISAKEQYDLNEITERHQIVRAGTYFIELSAVDEDNQPIKKVVKIHVKYPKTNLNYNMSEGIDAHDIVMLTGTFNPDDQIELKQLAGAHAWSMETGKEIDIVHIESAKVSPQTGAVSEVTFSTQKNTPVQVNVYEQDEINLGLDEVYMNQKSVLEDRLLRLSLMTFILLVLPILMYIVVLHIIRSRTESIKELLN